MNNKVTTAKKNWFVQNPNKLKSKSAGLNKKYGHYDYMNDARLLYQPELKSFLKPFQTKSKRSIIVGANDGCEAQLIKNRSSKIYGVDLAHEALNRSVSKGIIPIIADAENLPFINNYFSIYMALRALYSSHTDFKKAISEATRVLSPKGQLIISVPNGYLVNGKIIHGMYDYKTKKINKNLPTVYTNKTISFLKRMPFHDIKIHKVGAEIFITAKKL